MKGLIGKIYQSDGNKEHGTVYFASLPTQSPFVELKKDNKGEWMVQDGQTQKTIKEFFNQLLKEQNKRRENGEENVASLNSMRLIKVRSKTQQEEKKAQKLKL